MRQGTGIRNWICTISLCHVCLLMSCYLWVYACQSMCTRRCLRRPGQVSGRSMGLAFGVVPPSPQCRVEAFSITESLGILIYL